MARIGLVRGSAALALELALNIAAASSAMRANLASKRFIGSFLFFMSHISPVGKRRGWRFLRGGLEDRTISGIGAEMSARNRIAGFGGAARKWVAGSMLSRWD